MDFTKTPDVTDQEWERWAQTIVAPEPASLEQRRNLSERFMRVLLGKTA